ncbi:parathyroid hormone 2 receptor isoform X2 [Eurytemora carolleeae]|nr:parathyroid hormone 2 receptor isoform X2 [Eurytemora carolleeae]|eukprot:XP_023323841.1 parathyroid hormone 2 receptor-like isoform X2 [Eurytemora affinis]
MRTTQFGEDEGCSGYWDELVCWPHAPPNSKLIQPCPMHLQGVIKTSLAWRECGEDGWMDREGSSTMFSNQSFTHFKDCFPSRMFVDASKFLNDSDWNREWKDWVLDATAYV